MPINNIPGVGPTNADIATAVAAPSAATIASAVAAPSSATIATAVAAAVPTLTQINNSVATNAPSSNAWTYLGSFSPSSATSISLTGLSGYRAIRILAFFTVSQNGWPLAFRINSATDNFHMWGWGFNGNTAANRWGTTTNRGVIGSANLNAGDCYIDATFENCTSTTGPKAVSMNNMISSDQSGTHYMEQYGFSRTTAAVSSIQLLDVNSVQSMSGTLFIYGAK